MIAHRIIAALLLLDCAITGYEAVNKVPVGWWIPFAFFWGAWCVFWIGELKK